MVTVRVKQNASGAFQKLLKTSRALDKEGKATVHQLVELGQDVARQYVPKFSRQTYEAISTSEGIDKDGPMGQVFIRLVPRRDSKTLSTVDVAKMLADPSNRVGRHSIPPGHIKTGSRQFMEISRNWLNTRKTDVAKGNFRNINIR